MNVLAGLNSSECTTNPLYMLQRCPKSCQVCSGVPDSRDTSGLNTLLVAAIIAGVVAFIGILGFLFWCWRRKRSSRRSINKPKSPSPPSVEGDCLPPEEIIWLERQSRKSSRDPMVSSTDAAATNGRPNQVFTKGSPETSVADTISRSPDTHFAENEAVYEAISEDRHPEVFANTASNSNTLDNSDEYCYSYTTAEQSLPLEQDKNRPRPHEAPKTDAPFYHALEGPNAGYQALEGTPANGYTPMAGKTEQSGYQPLQKSTRSVYQPLKKDK
ncbi:hypothetical protein OS493_035960 [Desmophyllum pertusum]|uniref:ShKT domain-containing protein n=1 Tax=Desmophyllum pertusum TaxID=174260 RepID=A0A9W9YJR9_9CNID|nr:hypothetical protein OS493_035960 [Desmophyllum pertusum]